MTLALIAGTGGLPPHLATRLTEQGRKTILCEMRGFASEVTQDFPKVAFRIETFGTFLLDLTDLGVTEICMAGAMQRPDVDPSAIDAATAPVVPRLSAAMAKGDDGTLREIVAIFQEHGFKVIPAHQIAPDLLPDAGTLTQTPAPDLAASLAAAQQALVDMGQRDEGQAMLVRDGAVIAREDSRGTAAMLQDHFATDTAKGAVLFKAPKPDQILEADMPVIGPDTALQAVQAGLAGIVIPAGQVMVLGVDDITVTLDAQGLFLKVLA